MVHPPNSFGQLLSVSVFYNHILKMCVCYDFLMLTVVTANLLTMVWSFNVYTDCLIQMILLTMPKKETEVGIGT